MKRIDLKVSEAAKELLLRYIAQIEEEFQGPVVAVLWSEGGSVTRDGETTPLPAGWSVGFYEPTKIPTDEIQEISGIKFALCQGAISERLNGKTLDVKNEWFVVQES